MGILQAKGKYLGFVDSDDFVDETMYEKLFTKANQQNADISVCAYYGLNREKLEHFVLFNLDEWNSLIKL